MMLLPANTTWEIEPHTQAKHEILRRYLGAWFPILGSGNQHLVYIDGFCGPGRYKGGEYGSPIIALKQGLIHSARLSKNSVEFIFIDARDDRISHLKNELGRWKLPDNFKVYPLLGSFDDRFNKVMDDIEISGARLPPTFAFIDPFGFKGISFTSVQRLLKNPKTEVFINIMVDFINRFLKHPDPQTRQHIIDLFGDPAVLDIDKESGNRYDKLRLLYQEQLKKYAKYVRYFEMKNNQNRTIYYLFFATNHPIGHVKMKEAFWKIDPSSGFSFSDATDPNQLILFDINPSVELSKILFKQFDRKRLQVSEIKKFIEDKTPYIEKHLKDALDFMEENGDIFVSPYKVDGKTRRKRTFPGNAIIEF